MTNTCENCGEQVPFILYVRVTTDKSEKWCLNCFKNKFGCNCGKCKYCEKKRTWQEFEKDYNHR